MKKLFEKIWLRLCEKAKYDVKIRNNILWYWWKFYSINNDFAEVIKLCYINNIAYSVIDVEKMRLLSDEIFSQRPVTLYKFFSNITKNDDDGNSVNYSMDALENGEVFIKNPRDYNDPYDTYMSVNYDVFMLKRLQHYLSVKDAEFTENDDFDSLLCYFSRIVVEYIVNDGNNIHALAKLFDESSSKREQIKRVNFQLCLIEYIKQNNSDDETPEDTLQRVFNAIYHALRQEYLEQTKSTFKTACFTSRFDSILMWSHYADEHRGFCIEYDVSPNPKTDDLRLRLLPIIYCDYISDLTLEMCDSDSSIFSIYNKGLLRKSTDWRYENEWRLVYDFYSIEFDKTVDCFPIKRVLIGCKMKPYEKEKIIQFCKDKKIDYNGIRLNGVKYKMEHCEYKCENCQNHLKNLSKLTQE